MAKRGAEKQLTQDNVDEDERAENGDGEFNKASEQALAGRKIRGMPKRAGSKAATAAPAPAAQADAPKAPLFGATAGSNPFAAFGSNPSPAPTTSSPFSFGVAAAPASNVEAVKPAAPSFNFAASSSAPTPFSFSAPKPAGESKPAGDAAPPFSFGAPTAFGSSSFGSAPAAPAAASAPPAASTKTERSQAPALTYYTSLRALNLALIDSLTAAVEKDAFVDLTALGTLDKLQEKYKSYRREAQSTYDASNGKSIGDDSREAVPAPAPAAAPAFEIPEIFRNPPKPVPIADLSETGDQAPTPPKAFAPTVSDSEIPAIFRNPPKPVPIADLSEDADTPSSTATSTSLSKPAMAPTVDESEIPAIFRNPPKPVPIADLTEEKEESKQPPAPPAVFSFAGSTVKSAPSSSATPAVGGFVFKADSAAKDSSAQKSAFSFPPSALPANGTGSANSNGPASSAPAPAEATTSKSGPSSSRDELKAPSAPKLAPAKLTNPPAKPSPLRFGQSASPPTSPEKPDEAKAPAVAKSKSGFSFGATFGGIAKGDTGKKAAETKPDAPATAAPPSFAFGAASGASSGSSPFSFGASSSTTASTPSTGFSFGAPSSAAPKSSPFTFGSTAGSTPAISFGAAKPSSPSAASGGAAGSPPASFGFGSALQGGDASKSASNRSAGFGFGSSIGSPGGSGSSSVVPAATLSEKDQPAKATFGFSFGAAATPAASTSTPTASSAAPAALPAFSFAPPAPSSIGGAGNSTAPSEAATDSRAQTPGANPFTAPGEGEEGETTLFASRIKVWELKGTDAEVLGVANVQIKEKDGKVRILARNDTNGKVVVNFSLYSTLSISREKVFATFMGFTQDAKPTTYRFRFKTVEVLDEFEEAVRDAKTKLSS